MLFILRYHQSQCYYYFGKELMLQSILVQRNVFFNFVLKMDAQTLAEIKQQCKLWGWDLDEAIAEWNIGPYRKS